MLVFFVSLFKLLFSLFKLYFVLKNLLAWLLNLNRKGLNARDLNVDLSLKGSNVLKDIIFFFLFIVQNRCCLLVVCADGILQVS